MLKLANNEVLGEHEHLVQPREASEVLLLQIAGGEALGLDGTREHLAGPPADEIACPHQEHSGRGDDALDEQEQSESGGYALGEWEQISRGARSSTWAPGQGAHGEIDRGRGARQRCGEEVGNANLGVSM
jgi:hypothetical protein